MTIPLKRPLYPPDDPLNRETKPGEDILAIKRVVSRAGYWPWQEFDEIYSNRFSHGAKNSQGQILAGQEGVAGLAAYLNILPTGNWGKGLQEATQRMVIPKGLDHAGEPVWDQFSINLYRGYEDLSPAEEKVKEIFEYWDWLVAREPAYSYSQVRPIPIIRQGYKPPKMPNTGDCSGTFTACAWLAGAVSPDKFYGYGGFGNTDSLIRSGIPIHIDQMDTYCKTHYVGVFYGYSEWNTTHVVAAKSPNLLYSHGWEGGPETKTNIFYHSNKMVGIRAFPVL